MFASALDEFLRDFGDEYLPWISPVNSWKKAGARFILSRDAHFGSLESGKLADFDVIDKTYFTIPERELVTIRNLMTGIGGKIVYQSSNF